MKKTLLGVLAFVLVLTTVLTGVAVMSVNAEINVNRGDCLMVDPDGDPIIVDGKMDEAYMYGFRVNLDSKAAKFEGLYTDGVAFFAWSGSSIYCYVIVNDIDVAQCKMNDDGTPSHWKADCVEMYIHRGDNLSRDYPDTGNAALDTEEMPKNAAGKQRGRQYRIDGFDGKVSCYLFGEDLTYSWNEEKGRLYNENGAMITDTLNAFGWSEGGWGHHTFDTSADEADSPREDGKGTAGYAVEFKIDFDTPLQAGEKIRFDMMVNDLYGMNRYNAEAAMFYYKSGYRESAVAAESFIVQYDHFTLSDDKAMNGGIIEDAELYDYGRRDASKEKTADVVSKSLSKTERYSFTRIRTGSMTEGGSGSNTGSQPGGNNPGGNNPGGNNPGGNQTTTTKAPESSGGGCGGSIAATASVAVLAAVGSAGFYVFRKKDRK